VLRSRPALVAVLACLAALAGCADDDAADSSATNSTTLTVWSSLPLQGPRAAESRDVLDGQKLALLRAGGRVGPYTVKLSSLDAATAASGDWDPEQVAGNARRALRDRTTIAYLGESGAGATAISLPITNAAGIVQVSPLAGYAGFTSAAGADKGEPERFYPAGVRSFGRVAPPDSAEAAVLARALAGRDCSRVAVLAARDLEGRGLARALARALQDAGGRVEAAPPITVTQDSEPGDVAADVRDTGADCALYAGAGNAWAPALLDAVHRSQPELVLAAGAPAAAPGFARALAPATQRRMLVAAPRPAPGAGLRRMRADFRRTFGRPASAAAAFGHASMQVVLRAVARAGPAGGGNRRAVREALLGLPAAPTAVGRLGIRADGDPTLRGVALLALRGGRAVAS
jgi:branched-chain amino acid transport system substrate-binding protein